MCHNLTVSVMMPYYNNASTLPRALASVLAQTMTDWECIVVDDGSDDRPDEIIAIANDPRIRLIRLDRNQGRAVARQTALNEARGEYLAMLDADDWMFPTRLSDQVAVLFAHPELTLVSSSMAVVDDRNEISGVRPSTWNGAPRVKTFQTLDAPPVVHAPSMIRMIVAKQCTYEASFAVAEDYDFLFQLLLGRQHAMTGILHYAYAETATLTRQKIKNSYQVERSVLRHYVHRQPLRSRYLIARSHMKSLAYRAAFMLGMEHQLVSRRSALPTYDDQIAFLRARSIVDEKQRSVFGIAMQSQLAKVIPSGAMNHFGR